jgi:hypothetical protein
MEGGRRLSLNRISFHDDFLRASIYLFKNKNKKNYEKHFRQIGKITRLSNNAFHS